MSWAQIIGFTLLDSKTQKVVGEIMSVDETTINLLFDVKTQNGEEILIPANEELITNVDAEQRNIEVDIPNGLLEL